MKTDRSITDSWRRMAGALARARLVSCAAAVVLSAALTTAMAAPHEWGLPVPAPYQLVGVETRIDERFYDDSAGPAPTYIIVDLGAAEGRPPPDQDDLRRWIILGEQGWTKAFAVGVEKRCEYLCDAIAGNETCYYVAILDPQAGDKEIGAPLAAFPGAFELTDYAPLQGRERDTTPLQPGEEPLGLFDHEKYRITSVDDDSLTLAYHWPGSEDFFETTGQACTAREYGAFGLTETVCNGLSVLSGDEAPLIVSIPDYNSAKAKPLAVFTFGNTNYFIVRYGAKAQDIIGLVAAAPAGWRGLFRGRDHDLLC